MDNIKNILVTTMSVLNGPVRESKYYTEEGKKGKSFCVGLCTMEPGSKYILHKYPIDEIIAIGTDKTVDSAMGPAVNLGPTEDLETELKELEEDIDKRSAFEFYKYRIIKFLRKEEDTESLAEYLRERKDTGSLMEPCGENHARAMDNRGLVIRFVPEQVEGSSIDNISGIINAIYGSSVPEINLYIDVQGGSRTSSYVRNAVISILSNQYQDKIHIKEIVAVNFDPNDRTKPSEIADETKRYRVLDLASGMNAFIQYGKADLIEKYCENMQIDKKTKVGRLVGQMAAIDRAISLCDVTALSTAVEDMFRSSERTDISRWMGSAVPKNMVENIFNILTEGIRNDYETIWDEKHQWIDYLELISWCERKGFIQQALTLIEDKMPDVYFRKGDKGVFSYEFDCSNTAKNKFLKALAGFRYESEEWVLFNYLKYTDHIPDKTGLLPVVTENFTETGENGLEGLKRKLSRGLNRNSFVDDYCRFRRWEANYERYRNHTVESDHFTILRCRGQNKTFTKDGTSAKLKYFKVNKKLEGHIADLDQLFLLHEALKRERNCCNHASEKGHLPLGVVRRAIQIYVEDAKGVLAVVNP